MTRWTLFTAILAVASGGLGCGDETTKPKDTLSNGLLGYYTFNGTADDQSGNGKNGILFGGASVADDYLNITVGSDTDALSLPSTLANGLTDFTVAAWVRISLPQAGGDNQLVSGANAAQDNALGFWYSDPNSRWNLCLDGTTTNFDGDHLDDGTWYQVAVAREGTAATLYINGSKVGSAKTVSADALSVDPGGLIIGQDQDTVGGSFAADQSWAGQVDNLRFYNRALTASEVGRLYSGTK
jgi:MSHA biogenesis protein MshQ